MIGYGFLKSALRPPVREYILIGSLLAAFAAEWLYPPFRPALAAVALMAALPTAASAVRGIRRGKITIEAFNAFALAVAFATADARSAGFITLMLASAQLLEWRTQRRTEAAFAELLSLRPATATVETQGELREIPVGEVKRGDTVVVRAGARVPADGTVIFGAAHVNESSVTGESAPVAKVIGDFLYSGTLVESSALKIRAERVGADSTVERMAALMRRASSDRSKPERLADRFAAWFLPAVAAFGALVYAVTRNIEMTASIFLVACADDMAVAIPLAVTAALGGAARRGMLIKGGERLELLSRLRGVVLDKTGTLTYGALAVERFELQPGAESRELWSGLASAEKFAEHPAGRAIFRLAASKLDAVPDPEKFATVAGAGLCASAGGEEYLVGTADFLSSRGIAVPSAPLSEDGLAHILVSRAGRYVGRFIVSDLPRPEAGAALEELRGLGVRRIVMLTGDSPPAAARVAAALGIEEFHAAMKPEDKLAAVEKMLPDGPIAMVGDGINDAPVLSRSDIGIAIGSGAAVSLEAADVVLMTDDLRRLPEAVRLSRRLMGVIRADSIIWAASNLVGFALALTGIIGPALAALYNLLSDFLPLANSARMFRTASRKERPELKT